MEDQKCYFCGKDSAKLTIRYVKIAEYKIKSIMEIVMKTKNITIYWIDNSLQHSWKK